MSTQNCYRSYVWQLVHRWHFPGDIFLVTYNRWLFPGGVCQVTFSGWNFPGDIWQVALFPGDTCQATSSRWCLPGDTFQVNIAMWYLTFDICLNSIFVTLITCCSRVCPHHCCWEFAAFEERKRQFRSRRGKTHLTLLLLLTFNSRFRRTGGAPPMYQSKLKSKDLQSRLSW